MVGWRFLKQASRTQGLMDGFDLSADLFVAAMREDLCYGNPPVNRTS